MSGRRPGQARLVVGLGLLVLWSTPGRAHDPSAWGGLFRSRDHGATWFLASPGRYPTAALALAISPTDPNHLLLGTDSGLLRSRNGGRDWEAVAPSLLVGGVFATAFAADGRRALVSTSTSILRSDGDDQWHPTPALSGGAPARALVRGPGPGRAYLAGWNGLSRTDDWGASWSSAAEGLPPAPVTALVVAPGPPETVYVVVEGRIWASTDGAHTWMSRGERLPGIDVDALALDPGDPARLWAAGADRLVTSDDRGASWRPVGRPLPEANTPVHAIVTSGSRIVLATARGLYGSPDGGERWALLTENLPAHLEAGPLVRDPVDPATVYAGFAVMPYSELWRRAAGGGATLGRIDLTSLVGAVAFLVLLAAAAGIALRRLARHYRTPVGNAPARKSRDQGIEG